MAPFLALLALGLSGLATPEAGRVSAPGEAASALRARLAARASADPFSEVSAHAPFGTSDSDSDSDAEADLERDLLQALRQPGPSKVGAVLAQGVQAFTLGLAPLLRDPPAWEEGMRVLNGEFWKVVLLLVPEQHHWSREMSRAKSAWDAAFVQTPEITWDVAKFRSTGDTAALTQAFKSVIYLA